METLTYAKRLSEKPQHSVLGASLNCLPLSRLTITTPFKTAAPSPTESLVSIYIVQPVKSPRLPGTTHNQESRICDLVFGSWKSKDQVPRSSSAAQQVWGQPSSHETLGVGGEHVRAWQELKVLPPGDHLIAKRPIRKTSTHSSSIRVWNNNRSGIFQLGKQSSSWCLYL